MDFLKIIITATVFFIIVHFHLNTQVAIINCIHLCCIISRIYTVVDSGDMCTFGNFQAPLRIYQPQNNDHTMTFSHRGTGHTFTSVNGHTDTFVLGMIGISLADATQSILQELYVKHIVIISIIFLAINTSDTHEYLAEHQPD